MFTFNMHNARAGFSGVTPIGQGWTMPGAPGV